MGDYMLLLRLNEKSRISKTQQLIGQIRKKIEEQVLRPGESLPSTRKLATKLGLHRSTVALAYQELWSLGFVDLVPGATARVRSRRKIAARVDRSMQGIVNWKTVSSTAGNDIYEKYLHYPQYSGGKNTNIDFNRLTVDPRLFPKEQFRSCLNQVMKKQGAELLGYGDPVGYPPLREHLARNLQQHGIAVDADEILITNGSQQGIDLIFRMVAAPGKSIAFESPTYSGMLPLLRFSGLKALEIPVCPDGMNLAILEDHLRRDSPALIYTMPNFQNPTGASTSQAHREKLLALSEQYRIPILEDGFEEEMKYFGKVVLPVKSMDKHHLVIYCGTYSKVIFPGIRIGWIVAERECIQRLTAIKRFSELSSSMVLQAAMHQFCKNGYYDRHISRMHRVFRKRMQTALTALHDHILPEWAEWTEPSGGYLIWLRLKPFSAIAPDWSRLFDAYGVSVSCGTDFFFSEGSDAYFRLSIATLNEKEIEEGVLRLSKLLQHIYGQNRK
jgi:DNA-binding transcriptional MocR family regulator